MKILNGLDIIEALKHYLPRLTKAQLKRIVEIDDDYLLTIYLISAYNVYEVSRHMERCYMITNPEKLDSMKIDVDLFLKEVREFAFDALEVIKRKEEIERTQKAKKEDGNI